MTPLESLMKIENILSQAAVRGTKARPTVGELNEILDIAREAINQAEA